MIVELLIDGRALPADHRVPRSQLSRVTLAVTHTGRVQITISNLLTSYYTLTGRRVIALNLQESARIEVIEVADVNSPSAAINEHFNGLP